MSTTLPERTFVFWIPDWPIHAHHAADPHAIDPDSSPVALTATRRVVACSHSARMQGVRTGMREREATACCPELTLSPHDPTVDAQHFAPVLAAIEEVTPGIDPIRPGLCALRGRGPTRYYGSEEAAAEAILAVSAELGFPGARLGIADGLFAAQQAVRSESTAPEVIAPNDRLRIIPLGAAPAFLGPLPIERAAEEELAARLRGLGIATLGALAALPDHAIRNRFGPAGAAAHRRARALPPAHGLEVRPRAAVRELIAELAFETPIATAEQLAFVCSRLAEKFISDLTAERLVCTALRVELIDDIDLRHEQLWSHPQYFNAADTVNRIRWQSETGARSVERSGAGISQVRLTPARTERAAAHEPALWSTEADERLHHRFTQLQSRLGHTEVGTLSLTGGRLLTDRQHFTPWGMQFNERAAAGPWPGSLPGPKPSMVFPVPLPAQLWDAADRPVLIDADDLLSGHPSTFRLLPHDSLTNSSYTNDTQQPVRAWSTPWSIRERWWEGQTARFRLQVQLADGSAWLMLAERDQWFAEGVYS